MNAPVAPTLEQELADLWRALSQENEARSSPEEVAELASRCGEAAAASGLGIGALVERVLSLARPAPGSPETERTRLIDEAAATAAAAWERAREARREAWLSFLTHEMKNPLNTVLNAVWLLREHPGSPGAPRFLQLAERGVRRIEATLKDVRGLHEKAADPPPQPPRQHSAGLPDP